MPIVQSFGGDESYGWKGACAVIRLYRFVTCVFGCSAIIIAAWNVSDGLTVAPFCVQLKSWPQGVFFSVVLVEPDVLMHAARMFAIVVIFVASTV